MTRLARQLRPTRTMPRHGARQRGVATLLIVMALFFLVSLVAAYASRSLIFEQRTSANQYRSTQAFEAAEAGVEWALGQLNAGRVDASCLPTNDPAFDSFRERYLTVDPVTGLYGAAEWNNAGALQTRRAGCVRNGAAWTCDCPAAGVPVLAVPAGPGTFPAFRVRFEGGGVPGLLRIVSIGCTAANVNCLDTARGSAGDAAAQVVALVSLAPAMPTSPAAPLTLRGNLDVGAFPLHVANTDAATNGITIHAGGTVNAAAAKLESVPGAPGGLSVVDSDPSLAGLSADRMFTSFFGATRSTLKRQPTTVVLDCGAACGEALRVAVERNPGRPVWVNGDLTVDGDLQIGTPENPALVIVEGKIDILSAGTRIVGIVYSQAADWASGGTGIVQGAVLAEGNLAGASAPAVLFDAPVVNRIRLTTGPMIRVPGGWRDF